MLTITKIIMVFLNTVASVMPRSRMIPGGDGIQFKFFFLRDAAGDWFFSDNEPVSKILKFSTEIATVIKPLLADQAALNQIPLRVPYRVLLTVPLRFLWLHFCFVNINERTI